MSTVAAMAMVHEEMHQRACQEDCIGKHAQKVSRMFGDQVEGGNRHETDQHDPPARTKTLTVIIHPENLFPNNML
jgi:hypothetical protein